MPKAGVKLTRTNLKLLWAVLGIFQNLSGTFGKSFITDLNRFENLLTSLKMTRTSVKLLNYLRQYQNLLN